MRDRLNEARRIADSLLVAHAAINGLFFRLYSAANAPTFNDIALFNRKAVEIASDAIKKARQELDDAASYFASEAYSQAISDVSGKQKSFTAKANSKQQIKVIAQMFADYIAEGRNTLNTFSVRARVNYGAGWTKDESARLAKRTIAKKAARWTDGHYTNSRFALPHAIYLVIANVLSSTYYESYIQAASQHGVKSFRIVQPGHKRDGKRFTIHDFPYEDLHAQSSARIVAEV